MPRLSPLPQRPFRPGCEPYFAARRGHREQTKDTRLDALIAQIKAAAQAHAEETQDMLQDFERMRVGLRTRGEVWNQQSRYPLLAQAGLSALGRRTPSVAVLQPRSESVMQKKAIWEGDAEESAKFV